MTFIYLDFETRSRDADLKKTGAVRYAQDPTTEILCMSYAVDDGPVQRLLPPNNASAFKRGKSVHLESIDTFDFVSFREALCVGDDVEYVAHNISFERAILEFVLGIKTPLERWHDTAAISRYQALPGSLENLGAFFGQEKDMEGNKVMLKLCKPRPRRSKANPDLFWEKDKALETYERLYEYCDWDVVLLRKFHRKLRPMSEQERRVWLLTERSAERGVAIDGASLKLAKALIDREGERIGEKAKRATGGISVTQNAKMKKWLRLPNMQKATVEEALKHETDERRKYALMARLALSMASVKKLNAINDRMSNGNVVTHSLIYCGAERTGRWSGSGIQPQNFPRGWGGPKLHTVFDKLAAGEPIEDAHATISECLKGFLVGRNGRPLLVGDYSAIECRVLAWLAGQADVLDIFATGGDPYKHMASTIFEKPVEAVLKPERQLGKAAVLGCGYGMGGPKFQGTVEKPPYFIDITEDRAKEVVGIYREANSDIVSFWYELENAFRDCVGEPGVLVEVGGGDRPLINVRGHKGGHISIELPSGRRLYYHNVSIEYGGSDDKFGKGVIRYFGKDQRTYKYSNKVKTYGGKLVENVTQAVARDAMAEAMLRVENEFPVILTVHDEVAAELAKLIASSPELDAFAAKLTARDELHARTKGKKSDEFWDASLYDEGHRASLIRFYQLLEQRPTWAQDLPLDVEAGVYMRYQK